MKDSCWWIVLICVMLAVIALIVAALSTPYASYAYYRNASPLRGIDGNARLNCTLGEQYDEQLAMCAPIIHTPIPVSRELMDLSVSPCESFYRYSSGVWVKQHKNENRVFTYSYRRNQKVVHDIIRSPTSGPIYTFYRSCLDTLVHGHHKLIDRSQMRHITEHILGSLKTHADLPIVFARLGSYGFTSPFIFTIEPHPTKLKMIPLIRRDEFTINQIQALEWLKLDFPHLLECVRKLEAFATDETFEGSFIDYVRSNRYDRDLVSMQTLLDASPANFWKLYLRELNGYAMEGDIDQTEGQEVWVLDREYLLNLMHRMQEITVDQWKAYVRYSVYYHSHQFLPHLPQESYYRAHSPIAKHVHFRHKLDRIRGDPEYNEHSCLELTHHLLPGKISNMFLAKTFGPTRNRKALRDVRSVKEKVTEVVERIRDTFADVIQETSWLAESTRTALQEKLRAIIVRVAMPNYFEEEAVADRLTMDSYLRNTILLRKYLVTRNFELWTNSTPNRDHIQRFNTPTTETNAFYAPQSNTITILGGIVQLPFFDESFPPVALYASIGMIAAHEIGHALDTQGRLFDKDGSLSRNETWSQAEIAQFNNRTECLMAEFESPYECRNENYGQQVIGEAMSDLTGLIVAYRAFNPTTPQEKRSFFEIFGQLWADAYDIEKQCERVRQDVHPLAMFRVDATLRQMKEFREAFKCKLGDKMVNENPCVIYG